MQLNKHYGQPGQQTSDIKYTHFIYLSSDAVYKDSSNLINEKSLTEPDSFHGLMHLIREKLIINQLIHNLSIIRPTLVFGEGDPHNGYGPNLFLRNALENNSIYLFGKGEEKRDHVYISDVGKIISEIIFNKYLGVFNITSGRTITFYEIANKISKKFNNRIPINFKKRIGPMPHNGYRAFSNRLKIDKFKKFKYTTIDNWLTNLKI